MHPDGYLAFRAGLGWDGGLAANTALVTQYAVATAEAHAAVWQVLLDLDLYARITCRETAIDDPLSLLLTDPRQVRTTAVRDGMWVRPIDVAALLAARTYALELDVRVRVEDPLFGDATYRLRGGADGAECGRTDDSAELTLGVAELGSAYLGGVRLQALARAGLVESHDPAPLIRLDRALLTEQAPIHGTTF